MLRAIYIILDILFFACLFFSIFNVVKFVKPRQGYSILIILFYVIVFIDTLMHALVMAWLAVNPGYNPFYYKISAVYIVESVASASAYALSWLVTVTIFQLTLSIKLVFKKTTL